MKTINLKMFALIAMLAFGFSSCDDDDTTTAPVDNTIAGIASRNSNLTTLVSALDRAGLVSTLQGTGPYTVFAPTNAAFTTFLQQNGFANLEAVPVATLREILLNHVVSGSVQSTGLTNNTYIKTLGKGTASSTNTLSMYVNTTSGVRLNGVSSVVTTTPGETFNIIATNGVIHVVDAVIGLPTIVTHAAANPNFSILATVVTSTSTNGNGFGDQTAVAAALSNATTKTVFAPTNAAFTAATTGSGFAVGATPAQVTKVLQYHVTTAGNVLASSLTNGQVIPTITSPVQNLTINLTGGVKINDTTTTPSNIIITDVQCSNGVIHAVDKVLQPSL
ncbi:fasciclin domain-containing protein [Flavobacterium sp.]|uniref:fasciclin domain-containing protein n=1 Tax=Flavobacterium sp. TaxID=239 RepID=UPI002B4B6B58|nr:fasciclin domain-containing protein [Flavobacterium sp.]HLP65409.1 fasciclin domain-containing protein [Flavobacterium sp.]